MKQISYKQFLIAFKTFLKSKCNFLDAEYINTTELDQALAENEAEESQGKHGYSKV